jgi:hypothetical protein
MAARPRASLWVGALFAGVGIALVPWTVLLNEGLPSRHVSTHWKLVWTGFDVVLAAVLLLTAVAALRGSGALGRLAAASGTMLLCDAWFDTLTATTRTEVVVSVVEAVAAELPLAAICFVIAWRPERFGALRTVKASR